MPNDNQTHGFYAGVELHARSLLLHILNARGKSVSERDLPVKFTDSDKTPWEVTVSRKGNSAIELKMD